MKGKTTYSYWIIVILLLIATSLSFPDRQVLSITILKIKDDVPINDVEYGLINAGFLISYAIMFTLGGILIDRYGSQSNRVINEQGKEITGLGCTIYSKS